MLVKLLCNSTTTTLELSTPLTFSSLSLQINAHFKVSKSRLIHRGKLLQSDTDLLPLIADKSPVLHVVSSELLPNIPISSQPTLQPEQELSRQIVYLNGLPYLLTSTSSQAPPFNLQANQLRNRHVNAPFNLQAPALAQAPMGPHLPNPPLELPPQIQGAEARQNIAVPDDEFQQQGEGRVSPLFLALRLIFLVYILTGGGASRLYLMSFLGLVIFSFQVGFFSFLRALFFPPNDGVSAQPQPQQQEQREGEGQEHVLVKARRIATTFVTSLLVRPEMREREQAVM